MEDNNNLFEDQKNEDSTDKELDKSIEKWVGKIGGWIGYGILIAFVLFISKPSKQAHMQEWEEALDKAATDAGLGWELIHEFGKITGGTAIANELMIDYEKGWFTSSLYYGGELVSFGILWICFSSADS